MDALRNFSIKSFKTKPWVSIWLSLTVFVYPLSSTLRSFFLAFALLHIVFIAEYRRDLLKLFSTTWFKATLLLLGLVLMSCLWSPASLAKMGEVTGKYIKILYLPLLVVGFQNAKTREYSLQAFLLAMLITCLISLLAYHGYLPFFHIDPDRVFRNHIITGLLIAFAAYLSLIMWHRQQPPAKIVYGVLALLFSYQILFISGSRTGYILYFLLVFIFILQISTWREAIIGIGLISIVFAGCYLASPIMKLRFASISQQMTQYEQNIKNTDIGYRLQFYEFSQQLFKQHPIRGNGTASFGYYFNREKTERTRFPTLLEPHSQYWLAAVESGLLGLFALLFYYFSLIQASCKLNKMKHIALAVIPTFMVGSLSDSLLFYSSSGYFFILFMALCLGEGLENEKAQHSLQPTDTLTHENAY